MAASLLPVLFLFEMRHCKFGSKPSFDSWVSAIRSLVAAHISFIDIVVHWPLDTPGARPVGQAYSIRLKIDIFIGMSVVLCPRRLLLMCIRARIRFWPRVGHILVPFLMEIALCEEMLVGD